MVTKRKRLRARVALCDCTDPSREDRHWSMTCPACPGSRFHYACLPDAHQVGTLHIARQHPREVAQ